jgi:hypothetical protein
VVACERFLAGEPIGHRSMPHVKNELRKRGLDPQELVVCFPKPGLVQLEPELAEELSGALELVRSPS